MATLQKIIIHTVLAMFLLAPTAKAHGDLTLQVDAHHSAHCETFCSEDTQFDLSSCDQCLGHAPISALPMVLYPGHDSFCIINGSNHPSIQLDQNLPPPKFI